MPALAFLNNAQIVVKERWSTVYETSNKNDPMHVFSSVLVLIFRRCLQESNSVDVDVVQIEKRARLTEREREVVTAFANNMLRWCANDVIRSMKDDLSSAEEVEAVELRSASGSSKVLHVHM